MEGTPRDHCVQPPCKTGCLQQAAQVGVHAALEYLQTRRSHSLAGQPVPQLCHPHREEVPSHAGAELPVLQLTAISPCLRPRRAPLLFRDRSPAHLRRGGAVLSTRSRCAAASASLLPGQQRLPPRCPAPPTAGSQRPLPRAAAQPIAAGGAAADQRDPGGGAGRCCR